MAMLALLMAGTSWAVASWVSTWLVLPYLILMALLLSPSTSTGSRQGDPASEGSESSDSLRSARPVGDFDDPDLSSDGPDSSGLPGDGPEQAGASKPAKGRRGKGRVKKEKPTPGPSDATWVQVAPGKFVRIEAPDDSTGQAGPHSQVGVPVEVTTTPQRLEFEENEPFKPVDDEAPSGVESEARLEGPGPLGSGPIEGAGPAFDLVEGPEGDPIGDVESGSSTDREGDETAELSGTFVRSSTADGNAPQVGESSESPEATTPDGSFAAAVDDRPEVEAVEGCEWEDDPLSAPEDPELAEAEALADVPPEPANERGAPLEGTDPTETPVDETDLDDAGPLEAAPREWESPTDADLPETVSLPAPSGGPSSWPWRLAPGARTRVGHALPRAIGRTSPPPGRTVRTREGARRPPDPRRIGRRGVARPRQVNRTFPPRSPPPRRVGRRQ